MRSTLPGAGHCVRLGFHVSVPVPARRTPLPAEQAGEDGIAYGAGGPLIKANKTTRVNRMIRIPRVLVIDEEGEQLGQMDTRDALALAHETLQDEVSAYV